MPTVKLYPTDDAFVLGNVPDPNLNFGKHDKLWISSDSCGGKFSVTGRTHETAWTYLKFKLPDNIKPEWIKSVKLHLFIPDARFVGSTVEVTDLAIRILSTTPDWNEDKITWNNKPDGEFITRVILKSCQELGDLCGKTGWCQVGGSYNLGHVNIPLLFWKVHNGYLSFIVQPGADNNAMWAYSKDANVSNELKPYIEVTYEPVEVEVPEAPTVPEVTIPPPTYVEKVDLLFTLMRGLRKVYATVGETKKELKFVGDSFVLSLKPNTEFELLAYAKPGVLGFRAKLVAAEGKEVTVGFPWKIKVTNATFA